jgi:ribosomal-protein-alanine N-acetyltransferase
MNVQIRPQRVYDAKRFYEILSSQNFIYFPVKPKSIEEEKKFLRMNSDKRKRKAEFNFSIIYNTKHVGAIGIRIDQFRSFIGEIGYFIDENFWGKGIASHALKQIEKFILSDLSLHRIEIRMAKQNKASQKIAIKSGYKKEGILKQSLLVENKWYDCYLYSKIL